MIDVQTETKEVVFKVNINGHEHELTESEAEDLRGQLGDALEEAQR